VNLAVLDHGMGNLRSVAKAFEAAGTRVSVTSDVNELERADALCVPGQGIFGRCMQGIVDRGLRDALLQWIDEGKPFFGICLGMQILFESSDEEGHVDGLGLLQGRVTRLEGDVRIPHIGWNTLSGPNGAEPSPRYFYFDHSFAAHPADESIVRAWCEHGRRFAAWIETGSVTAVQFHPEKSGDQGLKLLQEWVSAI
jgi:imidazole glycerol-phosphate synthase subunit HisH